MPPESTFISSAMIDAYIGAHLAETHGQYGVGKPGGRVAVARGLEAAISAQVFGLRGILQQAREVFSSEPVAVDALNYIDQLIERQSV